MYKGCGKLLRKEGDKQASSDSRGEFPQFGNLGGISALLVSVCCEGGLPLA